MGNDPNTSVLNKNCQAHDAKNVVRRRRRPVRVAGRQELHLDDPGARRCAPASSSRTSARRARSSHDQDQSPIDARPARVRSAGGRASRGPTPKPRRRAQAAQARAPAARREAGLQAEVLHRARVRDRARAGRPHHPEGRAIGQRDRRRRAGVHGLHDGRPTPATGRRAMRGGLAWIDLECEDRFDKRFLECTRAASAPPCSTTSRGRAKAKPEFAHGVAFFNSFRDLTAAGLLLEQDGRDRPAIHGQRHGPGVEGMPGRSAAEARRRRARPSS